MLIGGSVRAGFEPVREAFAENFSQRRELGGACCVYQHGEKVVDLWGGVRDQSSGAPWQEDTMVLVYSATKGLAARLIGFPFRFALATLSSRSNIRRARGLRAAGGRAAHLRARPGGALGRRRRAGGSTTSAC
jgi:hypothetical protein